MTSLNLKQRAILTAAAAVAVGALAANVQATQYIYTPTDTTTDPWTTSANWSATPVSAADTELSFVGDNATVLSAMINGSQNDMGNFQLNMLDLQGTGPVSPDSAKVYFEAGPIEFVANGATNPVVNLNANGALTYEIWASEVKLTNDTNFQGTGTAGFYFKNPVTGTGALIKQGSSSLHLSGANTYSGGTQLKGGNLYVSNDSALGTGSVLFSSATELRTDTADLTIANPIVAQASGSGTKIRNVFNGGTVTFTGGVTSDSTEGMTLYGANDGGDFETIKFTTNPVLLPTSKWMQITNEAIAQFDVAGNTWALTQITSGGVRLGIDDALPTTADLRFNLQYDVSKMFDMNGHNQTVGLLTATTFNSNTVTLPGSSVITNNGAADSTSVLTVANGASTINTKATASDGRTAIVAIQDGVNGGKVAIYKTDPGNLTGTSAMILNGDNTYSGGTTIHAATAGKYSYVQANDSNALGSGSVDFDAGSVGNAELRLGNGVNLPNPIVADGIATIRSAAKDAVSTISGGITGDARVNLYAFWNPGTIKVEANPINIGTNELSVSNQATVEFNVAGGTWGSTGISEGTARIGVDDGLATSSYFEFDDTYSKAKTLDLNGHNQTLAGVSLVNPNTGTHVITNGGATQSVLTVNVPDTLGYDFGGVIQDGASSIALTKAGLGTQTLSGDNTYTGVTTVQGGKLILANNAKRPVLSGAGADVQGGRLVLDYNDTGTAPDVKSILTAGFGQTPKFSTGQIHTTNPDATDKGLGWKDDTTAKQVTVAYTYYGDANLDGQVDVTDLGALATNWQTSNVWAGGDFNYDGFVDVTDLGALATNWQKGVGSPLGPGSFEAALQSLGLGNTSVPEPASIGLIGIGLVGFVSRQRRRAGMAR